MAKTKSVRKPPAPSEYVESVRFSAWLKAQGLLHTHIPMSTYTPSFGQLARNKAMGVVKGFPDYVILLPHKIVFVEMKKTRGGRVAKEQSVWIQRLAALGLAATVAHGFEEAKAFIEREMKE